MTSRNHTSVRTLRDDVSDLMAKEKCLWQQRGCVEWLKSGDQNTSYFHSQASQRNKCNFFSKLHLDDDSVVEDEAQIREALVDYFRNMFTSSNPTSFDPILSGVDARITPQMNVSLTRDFTTLEVKCALKQMKPLIAFRPDGMPPIFYKNYQNIVG